MSKMENNIDRIRLLLQRYANGRISQEEVDELFAWIRKPENDDKLTHLLTEMLESTRADQNYDEAHWKDMIRRIVFESYTAEPGEKIRSVGKRIKPAGTFQVHHKTVLWLRATAAVLIIGALSLPAYWFLLHNKKVEKPQIADISVRYKNDVPPGTNKAVLTLGDNSTIILDTAHKGMLSQQGNTQVVKLVNGKLSYKVNDKEPVKVLYNTISTPRGGQYQVRLPDGSQVWLNATSSIKFPTTFTGNKREVRLLGEAYFEITKNPAKPFLVHISFPEETNRDSATVKVLGTHFNVMAYADEKTVNTTLLEGAVQLLTSSGEAIKIKPGEQVRLDRDNSIAVVADDGQATAWKDGMFLFKSVDIRTIMRQVARWYDIDVVYSDQPAPDTFTGKIPRSANLSQLLKILELSEVHFTIDGRKITVMP